ncbi:MAG: hypothetical protein LBG65_00010 [Puniceicoccales bacterium]|nr:hypothetical protein [Puniceicoccales bacterium]
MNSRNRFPKKGQFAAQARVYERNSRKQGGGGGGNSFSALRSLLIAFGGVAALAPQGVRADWIFHDEGSLTISSAGRVSALNGVSGAHLGEEIVKLHEIIFNGSGLGASQAQLIFDVGANVIFDDSTDFLTIASGKSGAISLFEGSGITFRNHSRTTSGTDAIYGGAISIEAGANFAIGPDYFGGTVGEVRFENNSVGGGSYAQGGAIGAVAGAGQKADVFINAGSISFTHNRAEGGVSVSGNFGGAIFAQGKGSGTGAHVNLQASSVIEFSNNYAYSAGGAIFAEIYNNNDNIRSEVSVVITASSILFENNSNELAGSDAYGGAIRVTAGGSNTAKNVSAKILLTARDGDIVFRNNAATSGAAISFDNFSANSSSGQEAFIFLNAGMGKIDISQNITRSTYQHSRGAVDIRGGGAPGASTLEMHAKQVDISSNTNRAIFLEQWRNPVEENSGLPAVFIQAEDSITLSHNTSPSDGEAWVRTGAGIFAQSRPSTDSLNTHIVIKTSGASDSSGDINIGSNTSTASFPTNAFRTAMGGGAISATAGGFASSGPPDHTSYRGSAGVRIDASGHLSIQHNELTLEKGADWVEGRSDKFTGGGAIFVFSTAEASSAIAAAGNGLLFDLSAAGDLYFANNQALGAANPNGGIISAVSVQNELDASSTGTVPVPIPAHGRLVSGGGMQIFGNVADGKGGVVYLLAETGAATLEVQLGVSGGGRDGWVYGNRAGYGVGATPDTGGAFHIEGATEANLVLDTRNMEDGGSLIFNENLVGHEEVSDIIRRSIYLKSGATGGSSSGNITFATGNGSDIHIGDGIDAVAAAGNTAGYTVSIHPTTGPYGSSSPGEFVQFGGAIIRIPGQTTVHGGLHGFMITDANGPARYQTYAEGATPSGSYTLESGASIGVAGMGHVIASAQHRFAEDSTLMFALQEGFLSGNTSALLKLEGGGMPATGAGYVLPGANKVMVSGSLVAGGRYFLLDATALGNGSVATSGDLNLDQLHINGNPVTPLTGSPTTGGRNYITAGLITGDSSNNKLYLQIGDVAGNTENTWKGTESTVWKSDSSTSAPGNWSGQVPSGDTTSYTYVQVGTFLHGDLVLFNSTAPDTKRAVAVDAAGVNVGSMTVDGDVTYTFSGGQILGATDQSTYHALLEPTLQPRTDGTLHIRNGATAIIKNTIQFPGSGALDLGGNPVAGVQVGSGRLVLADGGRLGVGDAQNVQLSNGATIEFNRSAGNNYTYHGTISGTGSLVKSGDGTLTLTANQTGDFSFAILGGTLILANVDLYTGNGWIESGGTLAGSGTASGGSWYTVHGGDISPGLTPGSIGTLSFGATEVLLQSGARYIVDLQAGGTADLLVVNGSLQLDGGFLVLAHVGGRIHVGEEFVIASAIADPLGAYGLIGGSLPTDTYSLDGNEFVAVTRETYDGGGNRTGMELLLRAVRAAPLVPEPSTYALCGGLGVLLLAFTCRRRKSSKKA